MNEHVAGVDQAYAAIRFRVGGPHRWRSNDAQAMTTDGSQLRLYAENGDQWFEFIPITPLTLRELDTRALDPITTLTSLATRNLAVDTDVNVRVSESSPWRRLYREREVVEKRNRPLFEASRLTAEQFASWVDLRARTDGLDAAALDTLDGVAIQTQVLAQVAIAEGLHRRLFPEKKRVPSLQLNEVKTLRRAARKAALEELGVLDRSDAEPLTDEDRGEFEQAINDAFSFLNDQTFKSRMQDLVDDAEKSIPTIVANFADWPGAVKYARNTLAHKGTEPQSDSTDQFYDLLIALSYSIAWVLRTVLLQRAGFDANSLQNAYKDSSAYNHHVTNTRRLLADGPYAAATE
jgi:hypothetical protein